MDAVMYNVARHNEPLKKLKTFILLRIILVFVFTTPKKMTKGALIIHCLALLRFKDSQATKLAEEYTP